jgi:hypothetical protein
MIIQPTGIAAYSTNDQIFQPPAEKQPAPPAEQKDAQSNGFITDRTDISAKALALSRSVPAAGSTVETGESQASEKGETKEEPAPSRPPQPQTNRQSSPAINIRV